MPKDLNWDLWLGPAPFRPFNPVYLPNNWRRWRDFGTGTLGDYNCHYMDPVFWALDLGLPEKIEANPEAGFDPATNRQTFPGAAEIRWDFPARGSKPPIAVTWHYGGNSGAIPPPMGWKDEDKLPSGGGGAIYGSKGTLVFGPIYASHPRSVEEAGRMGHAGQNPALSCRTGSVVQAAGSDLPRPFSHWMDWCGGGQSRQATGFARRLWRTVEPDRSVGQHRVLAERARFFITTRRRANSPGIPRPTSCSAENTAKAGACRYKSASARAACRPTDQVASLAPAP